MTHGFRRTRRGIVAEFSAPEREILLSLLQQTLDLLEGETGGEPVRPEPDAEGSEADSFEAIMRRAGFVGEGTDAATASTPPDASEPTDPAIRRLLPPAHHDDPELAAEFQRLAGRSVRDRKLSHLRAAVQVVATAGHGQIHPTEDQAVSLLIALTDVRLVLAERLGLDTDEAAEALSERISTMDPDDPRFALALGYEFLTWLQETLAVALQP